jgi:hypothetical protein
VISPRLGWAAVAVLTACAALTGCAASPPLDDATASSLQGEVRHIAALAAGRDYRGALHQLDILQADLASGIRSGQVNATRAAQVQASIDQIRTDLSTLALGPAPRPAASASAPTGLASRTSGGDTSGKARTKRPHGSGGGKRDGSGADQGDGGD